MPNVDGSSLGNPGRAGFGGLLRNLDGAWLLGFAGTIGVSTSLHAELCALYHGLLVAWSRGYRRLTCYSDSQIAIDLLKNEVPKFHQQAALICSIKDLLQRQWEVSILHTLREGNQCADFMAKLGAT